MELQGRVFLRSLVYSAIDRHGEPMLWFPLIDRLQRGSSRVNAHWSGPEAEAFRRAHNAALKAGAALDIVVTDVHGTASGELVGRITQIKLAPPRWPAARDTDQSQPATSGETTA